MKEIFEKIYDEKDANTNIAIFFGSIIALIVHFITNDLTLVVISFTAIFAFMKVASGYYWNALQNKKRIKSLKNDFSEIEREIIDSFISKGTCFISMSDYKNNVIGGDGLDSLVSRGVVVFYDNSFGDMPSGFRLEEGIYKAFLGQ